MSLVTLFTDASWSSTHRIGVWAMWAKCDGKTIRHSGKFNSPMRQSGTAELGAISYGLIQVAAGFTLTDDTKVIVQTDSQEAITAYTRGLHPRQEDRAIASHIKDFARSHGWRLDFRHVKGHKGNATPRNAVNNWCDKECHRQMGEALASVTRAAIELEAKKGNVISFPVDWREARG